MNRKIIEDIKVKKRIKLDYQHSDSIVVKRVTKRKKTTTRKISRNPKLINKKKNFSIYILILFFLSILIGVGFWGSIFFRNTNINIVKKQQSFFLNKKLFKASKNLKAEIPFEVMIVAGNKSEKISLSESKKISQKARGKIIIYNKNSKKKEFLPADTYLSDENGKVYLTDESVHIPGFTLIKNKIIPGKITVNITSFLPGKVYNGDPTDFYINAFRGTSKYKKIYGKAKTALVGGAQGLYYSLSKNDEGKLNNNSILKDQLTKKASLLIPKDYIFYPQASNFSYKIDNKNILSITPTADVAVSGTLSVVLLRKSELNNVILKTLLAKTPVKELKTIQITGLNKLSFEFSDKNQEINKDLKLLSFTLSGKLNLTWNPDLIQLKKNLLGISKKELPIIFKDYVGIKDASVKIFPPWQLTLPLDPSKIKINVL